MGFMDKVKGMLGQHSDKVSQGLDKAGKMADQKTKGKYSSQIRTGTQKAKDQAEKMGREGQGGGQKGQGGQEGRQGPEGRGESGKGPGGA